MTGQGGGGDNQLDLFAGTDFGGDDGISTEEEINALDELFAASQQYRSSLQYIELLNFISRLPRYSPFNCFLLHTQNPQISHVATASTWAKKFKRRPKREARPLVILAPMRPVLFVYDLKDTEGRPVPEELERPFATQGTLDLLIYERTKYNGALHKIAVREKMLGHQEAGMAICLNQENQAKYQYLNIESSARYLTVLNRDHSQEDRYATLAHELAHIFCGHLGVHEEDWWKGRAKLDNQQAEIEAESVAYLVCRRRGLLASSEKYLADYINDDAEMPPFSLHTIFQATAFIEEMGKSQWKKAKK